MKYYLERHNRNFYSLLKLFSHGAIVEEWPVEAAKKGILSFFSSLEASAFSVALALTEAR
jgi:hypothetical protein